MADPLNSVGTRVTSQTERARPDQVRNSAGGYAFQVDDWQRALRFLILGTDGGTYYVSQRDLTKDNADVILRLANGSDSAKLVELIVDVSVNGRAPRQNPTLFALAACTASPDVATRRAATNAIGTVCRTGTHLFIFARYVEQFRGWGPSLRRAVANWYLRDTDTVAFQAVKYRQREGWSHRDLLRLSHPQATDDAHRDLFNWIVGRGDDVIHLPRIVEGYERAQRATTAREWVDIVTNYRVPWETLPDAALTAPSVWEALLPHLGQTALIRQLPRLTRLGVISPMGGSTSVIAAKLADRDALARGRVHPLAVLVALSTYTGGTGYRSKAEWTPVPKIIDALNEAFYLAFDTIEPAGKRTLLGLDVSGSMTMGSVANSPLTPLEAEAAMAMTVVRTEPEYFTMAFSRGFISLPLTPSQRLSDVLATMNGMPFGGTDCARPMLWAAENRVEVDTFLIYTDNETWAGSMHPFQALRQYRERMGIDARMAVIGMTATGFSIADPTDAGTLDVVGFDTATPSLLTAFSARDL